MNHDYDDIRSKIAEPPQWFDENAVPRYVPFRPSHLSNIYAREGALVEIACQGCHTRFKVAFSRSIMDDILAHREVPLHSLPRKLADMIAGKTIHYGDPPNINCCPAGPTMNSDPLRVLEYWRRDSTTEHEWRRDQSLEIDLT